MTLQKIFFTICLLASTPYAIFAQSCTCSVKDVQSNKVKPCDKVIGDIDTVYTSDQFKNAINQINASGGGRTILIANGTYQIASTASYPYITASNVVFRSLSGNRDSVILTGGGMKDVAPSVENGFYFVGNNITIADLTIKEVGNHAIATHGDSLLVHNVRIQNTYEQMIKGTSAGDGPDVGTVQCSLLEYPKGVGPQYYIGGLDIHEGNSWLVRDNVFLNIASPTTALAEHAIHFWNNSGNNTIERNVIINCDRGIGFGLGSSPNNGGIIRNNTIYNNGLGVNEDVGIGLETSPNTKVYNNTIFINYPNAIEYRFAKTTNVKIVNNLTNQSIRLREGASASVSSNLTIADSSWFINVKAGNLRLRAKRASVVDQGVTLATDVMDDLDQLSRPQGVGYDLGAHEFKTILSDDDIVLSAAKVSISPNPAFEFISITPGFSSEMAIDVRNAIGQHFGFFASSGSTSKMEIDIRNWPSGVYFLCLDQHDETTQTFKVVVAR